LPTDGLMQVTVTGGNGGQWDFLIDNIQYTPGGQFDISFSSFIPSDHVGGPPNARCGFPPLNRLSFEGDNRGFSASATKFRTRQIVSVAADEAVDDDGLIAGTDKNLVGATRSYAPDALADGKIDAADDDGVLGDCKLLHAEGTASTSDMHIDVTRIDEKKVQVHLHGGAGNPLVFGAPDIDWDFSLEIDVSGSSPTWTLTGDHDGFPAYEIYINGKTIYTYSPGTPPFGFNDLRALFPPLDVSVSKSGTLN
jgi:hypothetical protein